MGEIVRDFGQEVWDVLKKDYLNFYDDLNSAKLQECVNGFQKLGFPQCCGAIGKLSVDLQNLQRCNDFHIKYSTFNFIPIRWMPC